MHFTRPNGRAHETFNYAHALLFVSEAPIYISFPHFFKADPKLLDAVAGLNPVEEIHESYIKIQPVSKPYKESYISTRKSLYQSGIKSGIILIKDQRLE